MPKSELTFYGCFGRFRGDAPETYRDHSSEWTLVRNKKDKGRRGQISKFDNGEDCWVRMPGNKSNVLFAVAPREDSTYIDEERGNAKRPMVFPRKQVRKSALQKKERFKRQNEQKFENFESLLKEFQRNNALLVEEHKSVIGQVIELHQGFNRTAAAMLAQAVP